MKPLGLFAIVALIALSASDAIAATPMPRWGVAKAHSALISALRIEASDETGGCDSAAIPTGFECDYAFRVNTIRQLKPVGTYIRGKVYPGLAFIVVADVTPIAGDFQYGTLASFCLRVVTNKAVRSKYPHGWLLTGFDTLQTAVSGQAPHGCKTTPEAFRASGAPA